MFDAYCEAKGYLEVGDDTLTVSWDGVDLTFHDLSTEQVMSIIEWVRAGPSAERVAATLGKIRSRGPDADPPKGVVTVGGDGVLTKEQVVEAAAEKIQRGVDTDLFTNTKRPDPHDETRVMQTALPDEGGAAVDELTRLSQEMGGYDELEETPQDPRPVAQQIDEDTPHPEESAQKRPGLDPTAVMAAYAAQEQKKAEAPAEKQDPVAQAGQNMIEMLRPEGAALPEVSDAARKAVEEQVRRLQESANALNQNQRAIIPVVGEQYEGQVVHQVHYEGQTARLTLANGVKVTMDMRTGRETERTGKPTMSARPSTVDLGVTPHTTELLNHFVNYLGCDVQKTIASLEELKEQEHIGVKNVQDIPAVVRQYMEG